MLRIFLVILAFGFSSSAWAQSPDPSFLQKAITAVQAQRNLLADQSAGCQAQSEMQKDEVDRLKKQIEELTKKVEQPKE